MKLLNKTFPKNRNTECITNSADIQTGISHCPHCSAKPASEISLNGSPGTAREKSQTEEKKGNDLSVICAGTVFLILGVLTSLRFPLISFLFYIISYLVLGLEIITEALKSLRSGNFLDENFLMSIATVAAFSIREYPEAIGVMLFFRIGELFEHKALARSRKQILDTLDLRPETVLLLENGTTKEIPAQNAVPGDLVLVRPGDRIPLDGTVLHGKSRLDTSPVTGEPVPKSVKEGDHLLSGCLNLSGVLQLKIEKPLEESMVSKILDSVENAASSKPKIDRFLTRFARFYTPCVVGLALFTALIPSLITGDWRHWIYTAITFLVISCPCALVLSIPLTFFAGIGAGSRQGILFKSGSSLEALQKINTVIMDKTGTVTEGNFAVQECLPLSETVSRQELLKLAASCEQFSAHPIDGSILEAAAHENITPAPVESTREIAGKGIIVKQNGKEILCGNRKLMSESGVENLSSYENSPAGTEVLLAANRILIGAIRISDTLKPDAGTAVARLKKQGIHTVMLTGDDQSGAGSIASEIGIDTVYARLLPEEKLSHLVRIRSEKGAVMFVGDGLNDAPVLAGADVGAAMGSGADAAIDAADMVFITNAVTAIPESIRIAKTTGRIVTENIVLALCIKALVMILGLTGFASMWLAVLADTGVTVLCVLNAMRVLYKK